MTTPQVWSRTRATDNMSPVGSEPQPVAGSQSVPTNHLTSNAADNGSCKTDEELEKKELQRCYDFFSRTLSLWSGMAAAFGPLLSSYNPNNTIQIISMIIFQICLGLAIFVTCIVSPSLLFWNPETKFLLKCYRILVSLSVAILIIMMRAIHIVWTGKPYNSIITVLITGVLGIGYVLLVKLEILEDDNSIDDETLDNFSKLAIVFIGFALIMVCVLTSTIIRTVDFDIPLFVMIDLALFLLLIGTIFNQHFKAQAKNIYNLLLQLMLVFQVCIVTWKPLSDHIHPSYITTIVVPAMLLIAAVPVFSIVIMYVKKKVVDQHPAVQASPISRYLDLQLVTLVVIISVALIHVQSSQSTSASRLVFMWLYFVTSLTAIVEQLLFGHQPAAVWSVLRAIHLIVKVSFRVVAVAAVFQLMGGYKLLGIFKWLD